MDDLLNGSAVSIAQAIQAKTVSSRELLEALFQRIDQRNPPLNAIVALDKERAFERATALDERQSKGQSAGPLHGVPFTLKDVYNTEGLVTTMGTLGLQNYTPPHDATLVKRLKNAGAILIGKTNVSELCTAAETDNLVYGPTFNPYDHTRTCGGSSGGEAAAIASGCSPMGVGSDLGGSLRIPAHYCGVATIRPTIGRVACSFDLKGAREVGIRTGPDALLSTDGPMSRYVEDLPFILKLISGSDGIDPAAVDVPLRDDTAVDVRALNLGYFIDNGVSEPESSTVNALNKVATVLQRATTSLEEKPPTFMKDTLSVLMQLMSTSHRVQATEAALLAFGTQQPSDLLKKFLDKMRREEVQSHDFQMAWAAWDYFRSDVMRYLHPFDAIVCPVLPFTATHNHDSLWDDHLFPALSYCMAFSLVKVPVVTVRVGEDENGLPIGVQIVAKPWREDVALAIARVLERELGGWQSPS